MSLRTVDPDDDKTVKLSWLDWRILVEATDKIVVYSDVEAHQINEILGRIRKQANIK